MFPAGGLVLVPLLLSAGLLRDPGLELVFTLEAGLGGLHPKGKNIIFFPRDSKHIKIIVE